MSRYEEVAQDIIMKIGTGRLQPGQRMPLIKEIREEYGISYYTWWCAKQILVKRGIVELGGAGNNGYPIVSDNAPYFI